MKLLSEIKAEMVVIEKPAVPLDEDFTLEGTDTGFDENDPEQLCEECKPLGFCRKRHPEKLQNENGKNKQREALV